MEIETLRQILGRRVREKRQERGFTQEGLANPTSLTRTSITNIERGHQLVSLVALYEISSALGTEVGALIPSHGEVEREHAMMQKLPSTAADKADIANWIDSVTGDVD